MHRNLKVILAAALMLGSAATQADEQIELFDYPGARATGFNDINDRGIALGAAAVGLDIYPFLLNLRTRELTNLTPFPGNFLTFWEGINKHGIIVGSRFNNDDDTTVAFIRRPDGTFTFFSHPSAHTTTFATAINEQGLVTGVRDKADFRRVGFVYDSEKGKFTNFVAAHTTEPRGINKYGKIVGFAVVLAKDDPCGGGPVGHEARLYGFVRYRDGFITLFQFNGQDTIAYDVTDDGLVIGSVDDPPISAPRIFARRIPRERCVLLNVPRSKLIGVLGTEYVVGGINDFDRIVGTTVDTSDDGFIHHGFITKLER